MDQYEKLTDEQKEMVNEFIKNNIDTEYNICRSYGTRITNGKVEDDLAVKDEEEDRKFVGYFCNICNEYVIPLFTDDDLINHVVEHLKHDSLKLNW